MPSTDSKQNFAKLRDKILSQNGKEYWRSVEEFVDAPEFGDFIKQEYPQHAEEWDNSLSRRNFVKVMGASLALAGLSGCVMQPPEKIIPYVHANPDLLPGKPLYFATGMTLGGVTTGLLAKSYDGRPVKIEGNPDHPGSRGATDVLAQASLLGMYDPDRSQEVTYRATPKTWPNFITELRAKIDDNRTDGGAGIRFLTETVTSPTLIAQFRQVAAELPNSRWYQYEPVNNDNAMAGAKLAFGSPVHTVYHFDKADRVLSLDADIFSGFNVGYIKDYTRRRQYSDENKNISRLYMIESSVSITGAKSDHRLGVKPSAMPEIAKAIAAALGVGGASSAYSENAAWIAAMAKDLTANKGKSLVVAGRSQSPAVHALAHAMNAALGNVGQTVVYTEPLSPNTDKLQVDQLRELVADIDAGKVKILVMVDGNPVYNTPADLKLNADRLSKVPLRVHLGEHYDETGELCHWHVSGKHYLESWSDARAYDGTASIIQPLIAPLYDSHNAHELVQLFFKENFDKKDYDIIKEYWQKQNLSSAAPAAAPAAGTPAAGPTNAAASASTPPETATNAAAKATATPGKAPETLVPTTTAATPAKAATGSSGRCFANF
jgi:Anaerobic dehydrogenases, typically selenocysteine-containing